MSKRVTLTDRECEFIIYALEAMKTDGDSWKTVVRVGRIVYNDIIAKLSLKSEATKATTPVTAMESLDSAEATDVSNPAKDKKRTPPPGARKE